MIFYCSRNDAVCFIFLFFPFRTTYTYDRCYDHPRDIKEFGKQGSIPVCLESRGIQQGFRSGRQAGGRGVHEGRHIPTMIVEP